MRTHDVALYLHLLGVLTMISGIVVAGVAHAVARRSATAGEVATILRLARTGVLLAGPGALVVIAAGFWLVHLDGLSLGEPWLSKALGLFVVALALGGAGGRRPRQARELAERLRDAGEEITPALRRLLDDRFSALVNLASTLAMLGVLWLMVAKP